MRNRHFKHLKPTLIMTVIFTLIFTPLSILSIKAQAIVWDPIVQTTLIVNHLEQNSQLKEIKSNEAKIAGAQSIIALKMAEIQAVEEKVYKSLKSITIVIQNVKDIGYAYEISEDIGKYQNQMGALAKEHPELLVAAVKAEVALVNKGIDLLGYIVVASTATDANLMNNEQRIRIIRHVVDELRIMRGMAYSIVREMRYVAMNGFLGNLNFLGFRFQRDSKLVKQILDEYKKH